MNAPALVHSCNHSKPNAQNKTCFMRSIRSDDKPDMNSRIKNDPYLHALLARAKRGNHGICGVLMASGLLSVSPSIDHGVCGVLMAS